MPEALDRSRETAVRLEKRVRQLEHESHLMSHGLLASLDAASKAEADVKAANTAKVVASEATPDAELTGDAAIERDMLQRYQSIKEKSFPDVQEVTVGDVTFGNTFWPPTRPGWLLVDCRSEDEMVMPALHASLPS